jgi:hypothetical protein
MIDLDAKKSRYLQDSPSVRISGIAANLARVRSFGKNPQNSDLVKSLLRESRFFIEWVAPEVELEMAVELLELQRLLTRWLFGWEAIWQSETERQGAIALAKDWSDRLLARSGLV